MKNKFTYGLVGAAVLIGGYMVLVESKKDAPVETKDIQVWSLTENQARDMKEIVVTADGQEAKYVRDGDVWRLASEPKRDLKPGDWETAYNNLKTFMASRKVEEKAKDLAKYGLDKPTSTLRWGDEKTPFMFEVGEKNPTGDAYYVHVKQDDTVYTVASYKVDEWARLAKAPPLEPEATPAPAASGAAAPASPAPSAAPAESHDHDHGDHEGHNH